jgi:hypothetical protein
VSAPDATVATVRELIRERGDAALPSLTREELFTLGDAAQLAHAGDLAWWDGLDSAARALVAATAERGLIARNLLRAEPGRDEFVIDPAVQVVLRARSEPSWLMVLREPETSADTWLVASGVDLEADRTAAMLISARIEGIYANRLTTVDVGMTTLLGWLLGAPAEGKPYVARSVEMIRPREAGVRDTVTDTRLIVMTGTTTVHVSELDPDGNVGPAQPCTPDELRDLLSGGLRSGERCE